MSKNAYYLKIHFFVQDVNLGKFRRKSFVTVLSSVLELSHRSDSENDIVYCITLDEKRVQNNVFLMNKSVNKIRMLIEAEVVKLFIVVILSCCLLLIWIFFQYAYECCSSL